MNHIHWNTINEKLIILVRKHFTVLLLKARLILSITVGKSLLMMAMEYQSQLTALANEMPGTTTGPRKRSFKGTFNVYTCDLKLQS